MNPTVPDELISAYFDGEATPDERDEVERLLEESGELRQFLDDTSKLSALLHSFPRESAPAELAANVQQLVNAATVVSPATVPPKRSGLRREWTAFGAGILATMSALMLYVAVDRTTDQRSEMAPSANPESEAKRSYGKEQLNSELSIANIDRAAGFGDEEFAIGFKSAPAPLKTDDSPMARAPGPVAGSVNLQDIADLNPNGQVVGAIMDNSLAQLIPLDNQNFFLSLAQGDVNVGIANGVAVADLVVVDIDRGGNEIKAIFQRRSVQPLENSENKGLKESDSNAGGSQKKSKEQTSATDLFVFYVHAPADRVVSTLKESLENHPDIYKRLLPQVPIELPGNSIANFDSNSDASKSDANSGQTSHSLAESPETANSTVAGDSEARAVVNVYVGRNSTYSDDSARDGVGLAPAMSVRMSARADRQGEAESVPKKLDEKQALSRRTVAQVEKKLVTTKTNEDDVSDKPVQEYNNSQVGYTTFRVALDNTRQENTIPGRARQNQFNNFNGGQLNNSVSGNGVNNFLNSQRGNFRGAYNNRAIAENRDARLLRMLIVLRPEGSTPVPAPAP